MFTLLLPGFVWFEPLMITTERSKQSTIVFFFLPKKGHLKKVKCFIPPSEWLHLPHRLNWVCMRRGHSLWVCPRFYHSRFRLTGRRASGFCHKRSGSECKFLCLVCDDSSSGQVYQIKMKLPGTIRALQSKNIVLMARNRSKRLLFLLELNNRKSQVVLFTGLWLLRVCECCSRHK